MAYTIKKGDTLSGIAKANKTTVQKIMDANPSITNPSVIRAGAKINIPTAAAPAAPATPAAPPAPGTSTTTSVAPGSTTVVTSGVSSTGATQMDKFSPAQLASKFGVAAAVINSDKSLQDALNKILGLDGSGTMVTDPELQTQIIQGTSWYKNQTDTQRKYAFFKQTNPGQFAADLQTNASEIVKMWAESGLTITAADAIKYAEQMMQQSVIQDGKVIKYDKAYLQKLMASSIKFDTTNTFESNGKVIYDLDGKLETMAQALYDRAYDYGYPSTVSNDGFKKWFESSIRGLVAGTLNPEDIDDELEKRAMSLFPGLKDQMLRGQSLREAADPWINTIATTLEVDPKSLDLNNDIVQQALNYTDDKGNVSPMNLYGAKKLARRSKDFDFTQTAKEEKTNIAGIILRDHGYL
jgi:murein DD-endopeptidase MepM/ murein hydrolase activator NlpD